MAEAGRNRITSSHMLDHVGVTQGQKAGFRNRQILMAPQDIGQACRGSHNDSDMLSTLEQDLGE
jgi:hypothetical protein